MERDTFGLPVKRYVHGDHSDVHDKKEIDKSSKGSVDVLIAVDNPESQALLENRHASAVNHSKSSSEIAKDIEVVGIDAFVPSMEPDELHTVPVETPGTNADLILALQKTAPRRKWKTKSGDIEQTTTSTKDMTEMDHTKKEVQLKEEIVEESDLTKAQEKTVSQDLLCQRQDRGKPKKGEQSSVGSKQSKAFSKQVSKKDQPLTFEERKFVTRTAAGTDLGDSNVVNSCLTERAESKNVNYVNVDKKDSVEGSEKMMKDSTEKSEREKRKRIAYQQLQQQALEEVGVEERRRAQELYIRKQQDQNRHYELLKQQRERIQQPRHQQDNQKIRIQQELKHGVENEGVQSHSVAKLSLQSGKFKVTAVRSHEEKWGVHLYQDRITKQIKVGKLSDDGVIASMTPPLNVDDTVIKINGFNPTIEFPNPDLVELAAYLKSCLKLEWTILREAVDSPPSSPCKDLACKGPADAGIYKIVNKDSRVFDDELGDIDISQMNQNLEGTQGTGKHDNTPLCITDDDEDKVVRFLVKGKLYGFPGTDGTVVSNFWNYFKNDHPFFSICLCHKLHPYSKRKRFAVYFCVLSMGYAINVALLKSFYFDDVNICNAGCEVTSNSSGECACSGGRNDGRSCSAYENMCQYVSPIVLSAISALAITIYGEILKLIAQIGCFRGCQWTQDLCSRLNSLAQLVGAHLLTFFAGFSVTVLIAVFLLSRGDDQLIILESFIAMKAFSNIYWLAFAIPWFMYKYPKDKKRFYFKLECNEEEGRGSDHIEVESNGENARRENQALSLAEEGGKLSRQRDRL